MIVYSGKQYGNNFNNGDDAVFGDSNRPRDENGFKLRPGLQGDKWDFRGVNKKTDFHILQLGGMTLIDNSVSNAIVKWEVPTFVKGERTVSDIPTGLNEQSLKNLGYKNGVKDFNNSISEGTTSYRLITDEITYPHGGTEQNPEYKTKKTTYVEIEEDGLYYFLINGAFTYYGNTYDSVNSYKDKVRVQCFQQNKQGIFQDNVFQQTYRCTGNSASFQVSGLTLNQKGDKLIPAYGRASTSGTYGCFCGCTFRAVKLG